jgi:hypothetical protein
VVVKGRLSMNLRVALGFVFGTVVVVGCAGAAAADAITYNFEGETTTATGVGPTPYPESLTSLSITVSGVTMTITRSGGDGFDVVSDGSKPASWGSKYLGAFESPYTSNTYIIEFSQDVNGLVLQYGDHGSASLGSDVDTPVQASLWSGTGGTGTEIDSASATWGSTDFFPSFGTFTLTGTFRSATFSSGGSIPNTMYWDNITINTINPVPEPATIALVGAALGGVIVRRRRARAARS